MPSDPASSGHDSTASPPLRNWSHENDCDQAELLYPPLHQNGYRVRLLRMRTKSPGDSICCQLFTASLRDYHGRFDAISYAWGGEDSQQQICVNGQPFSVRANLYAFLKSWRNKNRSMRVVLWVDALCINQSNPVERNEQVSMMGSIYRAADNVLAYLGEGSYETTTMLPLMKDITRFENRLADSNQYRLLQAALENIFTQEYWKRLWIVQEVILARNVVFVCGEETVDQSQFQKLLYHRFVCKPDFLPSHAMEQLYAAQRLLLDKQDVQAKRRAMTHNLIDLIYGYGSLACSEPLDHVYGLLGLAQFCQGDRRGTQLSVDYSRSRAQLLCAVVEHETKEESIPLALTLYRILDPTSHNSSPNPDVLRIPVVLTLQRWKGVRYGYSNDFQIAQTCKMGASSSSSTTTTSAPPDARPITPRTLKPFNLDDQIWHVYDFVIPGIIELHLLITGEATADTATDDAAAGAEPDTGSMSIVWATSDKYDMSPLSDDRLTAAFNGFVALTQRARCWVEPENYHSHTLFMEVDQSELFAWLDVLTRIPTAAAIGETG